MTSWVLLPAFLVCLWAAGGVSSLCSHCHRSDHGLACHRDPAATSPYALNVSADLLNLRCLSPGDLYLTDVSNCSFAEVRRVQVSGCQLPRAPFLDFVERLGVAGESLSSVAFTDRQQIPGQLENHHLQSLANLVHVDLSGNGFTKLPYNLFSHSAELQSLDLSNNSVAQLPRTIFANLTKLKVLKLRSNNLQELHADYFTDLPVIETLDLSSNQINQIQHAILESKTLKNLNFSENRLEVLSHTVFSQVPNAENIDLSSNFLTALEPRTFDTLKKLESLNLGNNRLTNLPDNIFEKCWALKTLLLNNNGLSTLQHNYFPRPNTVLSYLDLSHNNITYPVIFQYYEPFPLDNQVKLKHLILSHNNIKVIPDSFSRLYIQMETLDLSNNLIKLLDFSSMSFLHYAVKLIVRNNRIEMVNFSDYHSYQKNSVVLSLEGNTIRCNCLLYKFARFVQGKDFEGRNDQYKLTVDDIERVWCTNDDGTAVRLLDVVTEELTCRIQKPMGNCTNSWRVHDETIITNCSNLDLREVPPFSTNISIPKNYSLMYDLRNNSISHLRGLLHPSLARMRYLVLSDNKLSSVNQTLLPKGLQVLDVRGNNLTTLSDATLHHFNATDMVLYLSHNPWRCDCDLINLLNFLHVPSRKVEDFDAMQCADHSEPLNTVSEHSLCPFFMQPMVLFTLVAILIVLVFFAVFGTVRFYKYKQGIKVWLFAHRMCLWAVTEEEMDADKEYDAFISFSHKDEEFVNKVLVPGLESGEPRFRLCLHYRDWIPGEYIQNQIVQSVEASRRTIVVLSHNFIESVWGQLEFRAAHSQALQDSTNRLIVVVYGEVPPQSELDEMLQLYISTRTYVRWGDAKFWEKLRYIMPHPRQ